MSDHDVGVDCSGFSFQTITGGDAAVGAGFSERHGSSPSSVATNSANVKGLTSAKDSEPVPATAARTGDLVRNERSTHIGVVRSVRRLSLTNAPIGIRMAAGRQAGLSADVELLVIEVAHSAEPGGQGGSDLPGPHVGLYYFLPNGTRLGAEDEAASTFESFYRPRVNP